MRAKRRPVSCDPPDNVAKIILNRFGQWRLPSIAGVITTPTMRPDGTILARPGYDATTRLYHFADPVLARLSMPERPSRLDADHAIELLQSLLTGFPFCSDIDHAVALSAIITPVVRGASCP